MAHHQALILLSINNLVNNNILQERMPSDMLITKEKKEKLKKIKYEGKDCYIQKRYTKLDETLRKCNVLSNDNYLIYINDKGEGYSRYKDLIINKYKETENDSFRHILLYKR